MIYKENWHREADSIERELDALKRQKIDAISAYLKALSRAGKLKDVSTPEIVAYAKLGVLRGFDLRGIYLDNADLSGCDLRESDLSGVPLRGANLTDANLSGAKLQKTRFQGAILIATDFTGADLRGAYLQEASFEMPVMQGADLRDAHYDWRDLEKMVGTPITNTSTQE